MFKTVGSFKGHFKGALNSKLPTFNYLFYLFFLKRRELWIFIEESFRSKKQNTASKTAVFRKLCSKTTENFLHKAPHIEIEYF